MSLRFFMIRVLTAAPAELLKLQAIRSCFLVLGRYVIAALAITALQNNIVAWHYSTTSLTVPAPTVRPPSRIAKRHVGAGLR